MLTSEKAVVCRKRRWMRSGEDVVPTVVDQRRFVFGIPPPQQEDDPLPTGRQLGNRFIRKRFPPLALVRTCRMCPHRQRGIEQKHPTISPCGEVAVFRRLE